MQHLPYRYDVANCLTFLYKLTYIMPYSMGESNVSPLYKKVLLVHAIIIGMFLYFVAGGNCLQKIVFKCVFNFFRDNLELCLAVDEQKEVRLVSLDIN